MKKLKKNIKIIYVNEDIQAKFGKCEMCVYAPVTVGDENEMCLVSLISYENFAINIDFSVCFVSLAFSILVENFALILSLFKKLKNGLMELKTT